MSLSTRITLLLTAVLLAGAFVGDRLQAAAFERLFRSVEQGRAEDSVRDIRRALEHESEALGRELARVAWSDTLYEIADRPRAPLPPPGLDPTVLAETRFDLLLVLDVDGYVRHYHASHPDRADLDGLQQFPESSINLSQVFGRNLDGAGVQDERGIVARGLIATEHGPLLLAARNLVPASHTATRRGLVVGGRFLGSALDAELEARLGFGVDVWRVGAPDLPQEVAAFESLATASPAPVVAPVDDRRLDVYTTLDDLRRRPEFLVRVVLGRDIATAAAVAGRSGLLMSLSLALGLLLALIFALRALVLRPIAALTRATVHIGEQEDYSLRIASDRTDELGRLGDEFDRMLARLQEARGQVIETARAAGMSEIAMGILHNVGNVLNSVNISTNLLSERVEGMCVEDLARLADVLRQRAGDLATFITQDPQGKHLQPFLSALVEQLANDRTQIAREIENLSQGIDHVCDLVKSQQGFARTTFVVERVPVARLVQDAVRMTERARPADGVKVEEELEIDLPELRIDRNKALEIIVNLVQNARQAVEAAGPRPGGHRVRVRAVRASNGNLRIEVHDTGVGIASENLTRVFQLGFTTKPKGSGLGLHTAANGAKVLGGSLHAESDGAGKGARFILELPVDCEARSEAA